MVLISHRGNIEGKTLFENSPLYIDDAIKLGYDVEVDIRYINNNFYLGHDSGQYKIPLKWLLDRKDKLWVHCKNREAIEMLRGVDLNYFWHDSDDMTLTSKGFVWSHPKIEPLKNSIAVLPDGRGYNLTKCYGVCSDYIKEYE